jgi:hypothetical protein
MPRFARTVGARRTNERDVSHVTANQRVRIGSNATA